MNQETTRPLYVIAREIGADWSKVNYAALPYLMAMHKLGRITDSYGSESAQGIVLRFLNNAGAWRGDTAKRIKLELKAMAK